MGVKSALLAFTEGDLRSALAGGTPASRDEVEVLVGRVFPGHAITPAQDGNLLDDLYPPDDVTYAAALGGAELYCDRRLMFDLPSELPQYLHVAGAGRRIVLHGMHSVVDWLGFAVWDDGRLVRSLSLSPDHGIQENIGEPYEFERPYWAGEHPVDPDPGWDDEVPYPLPFHPLDLGEAALRALFGFVVEDRARPDDLDAESVGLHGFRVRETTEPD